MADSLEAAHVLDLYMRTGGPIYNAGQHREHGPA